MVMATLEQDPTPLLGPGANINGSKHNINGGPRTEGPEALKIFPIRLEFGREKSIFLVLATYGVYLYYSHYEDMIPLKSLKILVSSDCVIQRRICRNV